MRAKMWGNMTISREKVIAAFNKCNWGNTLETPDDWITILEKGSLTDQERLFKLLFREDSSNSFIHSFFSFDTIKFFSNNMVQRYKRHDLEKKRKVWRFVYCNEKSSIPEMDWVQK
jgi:hypothetical protein